jgi:hypothetical protein
LLTEINELRKNKDELEQELAQFREIQAVEIADLAPLSDTIKVFGENGLNKKWVVEVTWGALFKIIAPHLLVTPRDYQVRSKLAHILCEKISFEHVNPSFNDEVYQTIKIHLQVLGLVKVELRLDPKDGEGNLFWSLTQSGHSLMMSLGAVRAKQ